MEDCRKKDLIHVAVGVIFNPKNQVLVALRSKSSDQGGLWEFPGGKLEPSEDSYQALCRELKEEIGVDVIKAKPLLQLSHTYKEKQVTLHTWVVLAFAGEPSGLEGQPLRWVQLSELPQLPFPDANKKIIERLNHDDWGSNFLL